MMNFSYLVLFQKQETTLSINSLHFTQKAYLQNIFLFYLETLCTIFLNLFAQNMQTSVSTRTNLQLRKQLTSILA
jgi:hypothetical protein